jgi:hypothetical protein
MGATAGYGSSFYGNFCDGNRSSSECLSGAYGGK